MQIGTALELLQHDLYIFPFNPGQTLHGERVEAQSQLSAEEKVLYNWETRTTVILSTNMTFRRKLEM